MWIFLKIGSEIKGFYFKHIDDNEYIHVPDIDSQKLNLSTLCSSELTIPKNNPSIGNGS